MDSFTETSSESWFSRIKSSFVGIFVGLIMIVISFPVLFLNEGRAVKTSKSLKEGAASVIDIPASPIQSANDGKLVHFTGMTVVPSTLRDTIFGVESKGLKLGRTVQMYQWKQTSESKTKEKIGGGKETVTTYDYKKEWSDTPIKSSDFKKPDGHQNPTSFPYKAENFSASDVTVGDFKIGESIVSELTGAKPLQMTEESSAKAPGATKPKLDDGAFYYGENPSSPAIGDTRVRFTSLDPSEISVLAMQKGDTVAPYHTGAGRDLQMVEMGNVSAASMFQSAARGNTFLTWGLRFGGWLLMFIGLTMLFKPLVMIGKFIPFIGTMIGAGTGLISFAIASVMSLVVVAIAWFVYRPLLGVVLFVVAGAIAVFAIMKIRAAKANAPGLAEPSPAV